MKHFGIMISLRYLIPIKLANLRGELPLFFDADISYVMAYGPCYSP